MSSKRDRDKQRDPISVDANDQPLIFTEEETDRLTPLIEKARKTNKLEEQHAAGVPLRIRKNHET
jgi:hypothetical protein